jgi:putative oxidoreductase
MSDLAALILRVVQGALLAGHGAQKLFGWFNGPGLQGTSGFMEMLGLRPGRPWAILAGLSEFGGGVLTVLGLLNPLGPIGIIASMIMATSRAHRGKPIWVTEGGAELPVTNIAAALALILSGSGKYSLDRALGTRLPGWLGPLGLLGVLGVVYYAENVGEGPPEEDEAREELAGEGEEEENEEAS